MNDPLSEAIEVISYLLGAGTIGEQEHAMERTGPDLLRRLELRPTAVRTPDYITEAGFGPGWYYPDAHEHAPRTP